MIILFASILGLVASIVRLVAVLLQREKNNRS